MNYYVYISYEENGRLYIGSRSCECLPEEDTKYFGSYSDDTFFPTEKSILAKFDTLEEAIEREVEMHEHFSVDTNSRFANKAKQTSSKFHYSVSGDENPSKRPEVREKISKAMMGDKNPAKRPEVREKLVEAHKSRGPVSDETRAKMSEAHKGQPSPRGMKGKTHSDETRARMRARRLARCAVRYFKSPGGKVYEVRSMRHFAVEQELNETALSMVANGTRRQHKGWTLA